MGAPEAFLKSPSRGRSWEGGKYKDLKENLFCDVNFDAIARFGF